VVYMPVGSDLCAKITFEHGISVDCIAIRLLVISWAALILLRLLATQGILSSSLLLPLYCNNRLHKTDGVKIKT